MSKWEIKMKTKNNELCKKSGFITLHLRRYSRAIRAILYNPNHSSLSMRYPLFFSIVTFQNPTLCLANNSCLWGAGG